MDKVPASYLFGSICKSLLCFVAVAVLQVGLWAIRVIAMILARIAPGLRYVFNILSDEQKRILKIWGTISADWRQRGLL